MNHTLQFETNKKQNKKQKNKKTKLTATQKKQNTGFIPLILLL